MAESVALQCRLGRGFAAYARTGNHINSDKRRGAMLLYMPEIGATRGTLVAGTSAVVGGGNGRPVGGFFQDHAAGLLLFTFDGRQLGQVHAPGPVPVRLVIAGIQAAEDHARSRASTRG